MHTTNIYLSLSINLAGKKRKCREPIDRNMDGVGVAPKQPNPYAYHKYKF